MPDRSKHQKKIIERYYDQRDAIMLTKLQELVTELYLADNPKQTERLWKRVRAAMVNLKVKAGLAEHILAQRDPAILAQNVREWLESADSSRGGGERSR